MEITKKKPMYVGVDEVCADWGVSRSKGYAIIKQLSDQMKAENPKLLTMAGKILIMLLKYCTGVESVVESYWL